MSQEQQLKALTVDSESEQVGIPHSWEVSLKMENSGKAEVGYGYE